MLRTHHYQLLVILISRAFGLDAIPEARFARLPAVVFRANVISPVFDPNYFLNIKYLSYLYDQQWLKLHQYMQYLHQDHLQRLHLD